MVESLVAWSCMLKYVHAWSCTVVYSYAWWWKAWLHVHRSMYILMYAKLYTDNLIIHPCVSLKKVCTRFSIFNTATMVHLPFYLRINFYPN